MAEKPAWQYDPAEHRKKHCWNEAEPGFVRNGSHIQGKCPNTLTKEEAGNLLADAVFVPLADEASEPDKLWTVHQGVIYEAVPTRPGAYHGYPWCSRPGMNRLPRLVEKRLNEMAIQKGCLREFKDWMKKHG